MDPIARSPFGVSSSRPSRCSIRPASVEHPGQLGQALERLGGVVAEQVAHAVHVGLGQRAGVGRVAQQVLELVEVAQLLHRLHRLAHAERVLALEVVGLVPALLREQLAQVTAELVHLPAQVHVVEQLVGQLLQLGPLLGRHRVEHRLHRRHPLGQLLEQLVERLGVLREEVAELLHELLEAGILALLAALEHLVERRHHVLHAGDVLGRHLLHRPAHLLEELVGELLAELVEQLLEAPRRLLRLEVVLGQLAHLAGEVVGQEVEAHVAVHGRLAGGLGAPLVAGALGVGVGLALGVVDGVALLVDDVVELAGDLVVDAAEVEAVEPVLALLAQLLEQLAHALQALAVAVPQALVHHPPQRGVDVTVVQQLVGQLLEQGIAVELEALLRAVPPRVREPTGHALTVPPAMRHLPSM